MDRIKADTSHNFKITANTKALNRHINYNHFIRLGLYYLGVLFIVIGLTNLINNLI